MVLGQVGTSQCLDGSDANTCKEVFCQACHQVADLWESYGAESTCKEIRRRFRIARRATLLQQVRALNAGAKFKRPLQWFGKKYRCGEQFHFTQSFRIACMQKQIVCTKLWLVLIRLSHGTLIIIVLHQAAKSLAQLLELLLLTPSLSSFATFPVET